MNYGRKKVQEFSYLIENIVWYVIKLLSIAAHVQSASPNDLLWYI